MESSSGPSRKLSTRPKSGLFEREGRVIKLDSQPVIILDSDADETSNGSQSCSTEEANERQKPKSRNRWAGMLSVDGTPDFSARKRFLSFEEETSSHRTQDYTRMNRVSQRMAKRRAQKRISDTYNPGLPGCSGSSHQHSDIVMSLSDEGETPSLDVSVSNEKKVKLLETKDSAMHSSVGGCNISQKITRSEYESNQSNFDQKRSSCTVVSNAYVRSRPVMSSKAGGDNDDEYFDLHATSKLSDRAKRYEDKPFTSQKSVAAITKSATPRPPLHPNGRRSSNANSFYNKPSLTKSDSSLSSEAANRTPRLKRQLTVGSKQSGNDAMKKRRLSRSKPEKPDYIDLDSGGEEQSGQIDTIKDQEQTVKLSVEEEGQKQCGRAKLSEEKRLSLIGPLIDADRPTVHLPVVLLMIGSIQLKVVEPAVLRRDTISLRYLHQDDHGNQSSGMPRCVTIDMKDISVVKSNLYNEEDPRQPVLALQTRGTTTAKLQGSFRLNNSDTAYDPKSLVSVKRYIFLVLKEMVDEATLSYLQYSVERATKHAVLWDELSREEVTSLLSGVHYNETRQQTIQYTPTLGNSKEHKKQSRIQTSTRKSVSTKVDQHQNNKDEDDNENDLPSLFSLMADDEPKVSLPREDLTARALESMRKAELKKVSVSEDLEATDELKGPEESSEKIVLRYKSSCTYGASGITVTTADIALLMPDCWLNDNLINFYLMYLYDSVLTDEQKSQTYVFSTFLHQKLTEMGKKENRRSGCNSIEEDKKQLRRWTKDVDLLSKDFLVIPVNQSNVHWYLVIVCYAHLAMNVDSQASSNPTSKSPHVSCHSTPSTDQWDSTQNSSRSHLPDTEVNRGQAEYLNNSASDMSCSDHALHVTNRTQTDQCGFTPKDSGLHLVYTDYRGKISEPIELKSLTDSPLTSDVSCSDHVKQLPVTNIPLMDHGDSTPKRLRSDLSDTEVNREKMDDSCEPMEYFKFLADSTSDISTSDHDHVKLFDVPAFETNMDGENQHENEVQESTSLIETNYKKIKVDEDRTESPSLSRSSTPTVQGFTDSFEDSLTKHPTLSGSKLDRVSARKKKASKESDPLKQKPCIMFFDSLKFSGKRQTTAAAKLIRRYLTREFQSQKPNDHFEFTYKNLPAEYPKVPRQPNSCDCGLFVCQFAESFFMNPISDYQSPIALMEWFSSCSVVSHKRQELRSLIEELGMKQTQTDKPTRN